jgi:hypothetical protein
MKIFFFILLICILYGGTSFSFISMIFLAKWGWGFSDTNSLWVAVTYLLVMMSSLLAICLMYIRKIL